MNEFGRNARISSRDTVLSPSQIISPELSRDEKLIWTDKPVSIRQHAQTVIFTMLFGIPFFGFAVFWTWGASAPLRDGVDTGITGFEYFFPMFGIPFLLVGLGLLLSPLWMALKARKTVYALTNHRLIIRQAFPKITIKSWSLDQLGALSRTGPAQGPGSLFFAEEITQNSNGVHTKKIGFIGIDQPKMLEQKIRELLAD